MLKLPEIISSKVEVNKKEKISTMEVKDPNSNGVDSKLIMEDQEEIKVGKAKIKVGSKEASKAGNKVGIRVAGMDKAMMGGVDNKIVDGEDKEDGDMI